LLLLGGVLDWIRSRDRHPVSPLTLLKIYPPIWV
jgi:hypothetical protein